MLLQILVYQAQMQTHVATVAGTKKFEVDSDTNTYGTPGEKL